MFPKQFLKSSKKASFSVVAMENNALSLKFQMTDDDDFRRRNQIFVNISLLRKGGPSCFLLFYRVSKLKLDCLTKSVSWKKYLANSESQKLPTGSEELSEKWNILCTVNCLGTPCTTSSSTHRNLRFSSWISIIFQSSTPVVRITFVEWREKSITKKTYIKTPAPLPPKCSEFRKWLLTWFYLTYWIS